VRDALQGLSDDQATRFLDDEAVQTAIHVRINRLIAFFDAALADDPITILQHLAQRANQRPRGSALGHSSRRQALEHSAHVERIENVGGAEAAHDIASSLMFLQQTFPGQHGKRLAHRCTRHPQHLRQRCLSQPLTWRELAAENHFPDANQRGGLLSTHGSAKALDLWRIVLDGIPTVNYR
jgi:hypothetical protein